MPLVKHLCKTVWVLNPLTQVLTDIINTSLSQTVVPTCLKTAIIIAFPKNSIEIGLNEYWLVALTPIVMKCLERLVMVHIKCSTDIPVDTHQYAFRRNRSTDDTVSAVVHMALNHSSTRTRMSTFSLWTLHQHSPTDTGEDIMTELLHLQLGAGFPDKMTTICQNLHNLLHQYPQYQFTSGPCAEPSPVQSADIRLLS